MQGVLIGGELVVLYEYDLPKERRDDFPPTNNKSDEAGNEAAVRYHGIRRGKTHEGVEIRDKTDSAGSAGKVLTSCRIPVSKAENAFTATAALPNPFVFFSPFGSAQKRT
jgi:hypothetical protein